MRDGSNSRETFPSLSTLSHQMPSLGRQHPSPGPVLYPLLQRIFLGAWLSVAVVGRGLNYGAIPVPSLREHQYRGQTAAFTSSPKFCEFWTPFKTEQINWGLSIVCRELRSSCYCSSSSAGTFLIELLLSPEETFRRLSEWRSLHILAKWFFDFIPRAIEFFLFTDVMAFGCAWTNSWVNSIFVFVAPAMFSFLPCSGLWPLVLTEPCLISTKERTEVRKRSLFLKCSEEKKKLIAVA